jgi:hypothetical protein
MSWHWLSVSSRAITPTEAVDQLAARDVHAQHLLATIDSNDDGPELADAMREGLVGFVRAMFLSTVHLAVLHMCASACMLRCSMRSFDRFS